MKLRANKPFPGHMLPHLLPEGNAQISVAAQVGGISLNQWAARALAQADNVWKVDVEGGCTSFQTAFVESCPLSLTV